MPDVDGQRGDGSLRLKARAAQKRLRQARAQPEALQGDASVMVGVIAARRPGSPPATASDVVTTSASRRDLTPPNLGAVRQEPDDRPHDT
ncbi:hypothetical protein [Sphingomonas sp. CFBP 13733]|uniref:hypothetical protein n=1 Tax=Sphingomonas sp. CFBP 13733 TaxID=2775291 RepID=UPI0017873479|nr:hypothetical protein [Sphingomonas sp. CFBP 13733]MBD8640257.1 hypothetical protein [Sphingomonas sp. CFBP 13733]